MIDRELDDFRFTDAGIRSQTRPRDAASVNTLEVRFTDPIAFIECLTADARMDAITDRIVWLARTSGQCSIQQIEGKWSAGGHRINPLWRTMYVEISYLARGQLHKGSFYCGPALIDAKVEEARTLETAQVLAAMERRLHAAVGKAGRDYKLEIRGGGALHLFDVGAPWMAHPDQTIEDVASYTCKTCGEEIYYANDAWRHASTGRKEVTETAMGKGARVIQRWHHDAEPAEAVEA